MGYNRSTAFTGGGLSALNPAAQGAATSVVPGFDAPLLQPYGNHVFRRRREQPESGHFAWNSYQVYDDAFLTKGKHSIKFGFAFEQMQDNYHQQARAGGLAGFGSLANFLTDIASKFQLTFPREFLRAACGRVSSEGTSRMTIAGNPISPLTWDFVMR